NYVHAGSAVYPVLLQQIGVALQLTSPISPPAGPLKRAEWYYAPTYRNVYRRGARSTASDTTWEEFNEPICCHGARVGIHGCDLVVKANYRKWPLFRFCDQRMQFCDDLYFRPVCRRSAWQPTDYHAGLMHHYLNRNLEASTGP